MASETESLHDNMTRIRLKMVQRKLANEREKLQRPESESTVSNGGQFKLQQALVRRQQLLDRLKQEQSNADDTRARSCSPRHHHRTPSPLPLPPSRRSLPADLLRGLSRAYRVNWRHPQHPAPYIVEHQLKPPAQPIVSARREVALPAIYQVPVVSQPAQVQSPPIQAVVQPVVSSLPKSNNPSFNKGDFMDMMMLQNAQMHHMVMQQMMLQNLPGNGSSCPTAQVPMAPIPMAPMMPSAPAPVVHHMQNLPPMEPRLPVNTRTYNSPTTFYDDGSNYYTYH